MAEIKPSAGALRAARAIHELSPEGLWDDSVQQAEGSRSDRETNGIAHIIDREIGGIMKVTLSRDEFWPYIVKSKHGGVVFKIPKKLWESYRAAQEAFEAEHGKLMDCIEDQRRTAKF